MKMDGIRLSSLSPHQLGELSDFIGKYGLGIELGEEKTANFLLRLWNAEEEKRKHGEKYSRKMLKDAESLILSMNSQASGQAAEKRTQIGPAQVPGIMRGMRPHDVPREVESMERKPKTGEEALRLLMKGNKNFVEGKMTQYDVVKRRKELLEGQQPFAAIVCCSDSRVEPVITFDANIGEIFVAKGAGNVLDSVGLGTIEYGVEHLKVPLLMILAHEKCGAVTACCKGGGNEGHVRDIMEKIRPSVIPGNVEASADANAKAVKSYILQNCDVLRRLVEERKLMVVVAKYHLESGKVTMLE